MTEVVAPREAYRLWAGTFDTSASPIVALESRWLAPVLGSVAGKTLIDIGCGTGRWLAWAAGHGARVAGADASLEMLRVGAEKPGAAGRIAQADGSQTPFRDASADIVLCTLTLGHLRPIGRAMAELARLVKPGGRVIVTDFHPEALRHGWKRTFRSGSSVFEIESEPYEIADLEDDRLRLEDTRELYFGEPERELFEAAGKSAMFEAVRAIPAILVVTFRRRQS